MYILYGTDESGSCMIEIALQRCAAPWRRVEASSWQDGEGSEALARINPLKQIPTLVTPDGQVLTESAAILIHLGLEYPQAELLAGNRAQILRGLLYIAANCYSAIGIIDYPQRWLGDADEALQAQLTTGTRRYLHQAWVVFADQFADQLFTPAMSQTHWASWRRRCRAGMRRGKRCTIWRQALPTPWSGWMPTRLLHPCSPGIGRIGRSRNQRKQ